jgi:hypothetical protein
LVRKIALACRQVSPVISDFFRILPIKGDRRPEERRPEEDREGNFDVASFNTNAWRKGKKGGLQQVK